MRCMRRALLTDTHYASPHHPPEIFSPKLPVNSSERDTGLSSGCSSNNSTLKAVSRSSEDSPGTHPIMTLIDEFCRSNAAAKL